MTDKNIPTNKSAGVLNLNNINLEWPEKPQVPMDLLQV